MKKTKFFSELALSLKKALKLHKFPGELWGRTPDKKRDWGNVSEHCLVEAVRAETIADLLHLPEQTKNDLKLAAALHDYDKKHEILETKKAMKTGEAVLPALEPIKEKARKNIEAAGFDGSVIDIFESAGGYPETMIKIKDIVDKERVSDQELSMLIMNYVDAYTHGSSWVNPTEQSGDEVLNDLDRKIIKIANNPTYAKLRAEAREQLKHAPFFKDKSDTEALVAIGHSIEKKLATLISERSGVKMDPIQLPEKIDEMIKNKISQI